MSWSNSHLDYCMGNWLKEDKLTAGDPVRRLSLFSNPERGPRLDGVEAGDVDKGLDQELLMPEF